MLRQIALGALLLILAGCAKPDGSPRSGGYSIFYSQADHMRALLDKKDYEGAAVLYRQEEKYFVDNQAKLAALLDQAAAGYNAQWQPRIEAAIASCARSDWPLPRQDWARLQGRLAECREVERGYENKLTAGARRSARIAELDKILADLNQRLQADLPALLKAEDLGSGRDFFADYPVPLANPAPLAARMKESFNPRDEARVFRVAETYAQEIRAHSPVKQEMAREVGELLAQQARSGSFQHIASLYQRAADKGIAPATIPVSVGIYTASAGGAPFAVTIDRDLPFDWRPMSSATAPTDADFVMALGPTKASLNRKVGDYRKVSSTYLAGTREVANPNYQTAILNLQRAQQMLANARTDQVVASREVSCTAYGCEKNQWAQIAANNNMQEAIDAYNMAQIVLQRTPRTVQVPVSEPYTYETALITSAKHAEVAAFVARARDRGAVESFATSIDPAQDFTVAYKVNAKDQGSGRSASYAQESAVAAWEKEPVSARLSDLLGKGGAKAGTSWQQLAASFGRASFVSNLTPAQPYAAVATATTGKADRRFDSVVVIRTADGLGSGFYITPDTILTNAHVVGNQSFVKMRTYAGEDVNGQVVASDARRDLALVKTEHSSIPVALSQKPVTVGSTVEVVGHPKGLVYTLTRGIVSQTRALPPTSGVGGGLVSYVQLDASISPGNSGGPVYQDGAVIGVATWKVVAQSAENLNFAVHRDEIASFLREHGIAP